MICKVWFKSWPLGLDTWLVLLGVFVTPTSWAAPVFCELAALPVLPLASDSAERFTPEELLNRVAESYRGLLEFAGDEFSAARLSSLLVEVSTLPPEKFFEPVPVAEQRSVALNESLTKLGDWVLLEAEEHGLTREMILARLREVVRTHVEHQRRERERVDETRGVRRDPGRETESGHLFIRDFSRPELGEAWRDESGMIWGDLVKKPDGSGLSMNHAQAIEHCQSIGADLPSNDDFVRLRQYMGAQSEIPDGYSPQILPKLDYGGFWSKSVHPDDSGRASSFSGILGNISYYERSYTMSFRCVAR